MAEENVFPDNVILIPEAEDDFTKFDNSQQLEILKGIKKVSTMPAAKPDGYGNPLRGTLKGYCKIKFLKLGVRVVYKHLRTTNGLFIIVISMRNDNLVYKIAEKRIAKLRCEGIIN